MSDDDSDGEEDIDDLESFEGIFLKVKKLRVYFLFYVFSRMREWTTYTCPGGRSSNLVRNILY